MKVKEAMHRPPTWIDFDAPIVDLAARDLAAEALQTLCSETLRAVSAHHA